MRATWLAAIAMLMMAGCRGGAGARAAQLPHPTDLGGWIAMAVVIFGGWWLLLKILRG